MRSVPAFFHCLGGTHTRMDDLVKSDDSRSCSEFYALLRKNFLIRTRAKVSLFLELLWPQFLFLIMLLIRGNDFSETVPTCYYHPKALPSSGFFPMLQSYICTLPNACLKDKQADWDLGSASQRIPLNEWLRSIRQGAQNESVINATINFVAAFGQLVDLLSSMKSTRTELSPVRLKKYWTKEEIMNIGGMNEETAAHLLNSALTPEFFKESLRHWFQNRSFHENFCRPDEIHKYLQVPLGAETKKTELSKTICKYFPFERTQEYMKYPFQSMILFSNYTGFGLKKFQMAKITTLSNFINTLLNYGIGNDMLKDLWTAIINENAANTSSNVEMFSTRLCGGPIKGLEEVFRKLRGMERFFEWVKHRELDSDNKTTEPEFVTCGSVELGQIDEDCWHWLRSYQMPKEFTAQLYALLRGIVLVSPSSQVVQKIVSEVQEKFLSLTATMNSIHLVLENSDSLSASFEKSKLFKAVKVLAQMYINADDALNVSGIIESGAKYRELAEFIASEGWKNSTSVHNHAYHFFRCFRPFKFHIVESEDNLMAIGSCLSKSHGLLAGIVFPQLHNMSSSLPKVTKYKIRMDGNLIDDTFQIKDGSWNERPRDRPFIDMKYSYFGYMFLQDAIDEVIISIQANTSHRMGIYAQQFPSPGYKTDLFIKTVGRLFPMLMTIAWMFSAGMIMKSIVSEKELGLKNFMAVMGLKKFVHWFAWLIQASTMLFISAVPVILLLKCGNILQHTNVICLLVFFILYLLAVIVQCFFMSTFFGRANFAAVVGTSLYFLFYLPYPTLLPNVRNLHYIIPLLMCILPQTAFGWGCAIIASFEESGYGIQWRNIAHLVNPNQKITFATILLMLLFDILLYATLTWLFDSKKGVSISWKFPFQLSKRLDVKYSTPPKNRKLLHCHVRGAKFMGLGAQGMTRRMENHEEVNFPIGVSAINLTKSYRCFYGEEKLALTDFNANFYENEITTLLGPNGAGKTTLLSIICGLVPPTSGTVVICGQNVCDQPKKLRQSLSYCPQHNILFDALTVEEHLHFYSALRRVNPMQEDEINQLLRRAKLLNKKNDSAKSLSGGMKRKLSIAIAFIGNPKVVILDEPTTSVDPYSRRSIWDMLLNYKKGRTIIISTHSFEEADVVSDRIAIIAAGTLKCFGSSVFLKHVYRTGYLLTFIKSPASAALQNLNSKKLINFVVDYTPDISVIRNTSQEMQFMLRNVSLDDLKPLIQAIDTRLRSLDCSSYGISESGLEEIFRKETSNENLEDVLQGFTSEPHEINSKHMHNEEICMKKLTEMNKTEPVLSNTKPADTELQENAACDEMKELLPILDSFQAVPSIQPSFLQSRRALASLYLQSTSLFKKRLLKMTRDIRTCLYLIILPTLIIGFSMISKEIHVPDSMDNPPLLMDPILYGNWTNSFFSSSNPSDSTNGSNYFLPVIRNQVEYGLGNSCQQENEETDNDISFPNLSCNSTVQWAHFNFKLGHNETFNPVLRCNPSETYTCEADYVENYTCRNGIVMKDVTLLNISQWIIATKDFYPELRYGGFSMVASPVIDTTINSTSLRENVKLIFDTFASFLSDMEINATVMNEQNLTILNHENTAKVIEYMSTTDNVKVWYNNRGWASLPSYASAFSNARCRSYMSKSTPMENYGIMVINHPMPKLSDESNNERNAVANSVLSFGILMAFSTVIGGFCIVVVEEKVIGIKQMHLLAGVPCWLYWFVNFVFDMVTYIIIVITVMAAMAIHQRNAFFGIEYASLVTLATILAFGISMIPFCYLASLVSKSANLLAMLVPVGAVFIGTITNLVVIMFEIFGQEDLYYRNTCDILKLVFIIFPPYCFSRSLTEIQMLNRVYELRSIPKDVHYYFDLMQWNALGKYSFAMLALGLLFLVLLIILEYKYSFAVMKCEKKLIRQRYGNSDGKKEIQASSCLKVDKLTKYYRKNVGKKKLIAVNDLSFEVQPGECFGLLGHNGAGKTTTFKMIIGEVDATEGKILFDGEMKAAHQTNLGYCPQFDALDKRLTGRETLLLYAGIRKIKQKFQNKTVNEYIEKLGLTKHADRLVKTYSGGLRRRLSTAVALIGGPHLILMDEPTAGTDPESRRFVWNAILNGILNGQSVLYTSNCMEDCEVLCNRVAIMARGKLIRLDTVQGLKNKIGLGYQVTVKLNNQNEAITDDACTHIRARLPEALILHRNTNTIKFRIPQSETVVSKAIEFISEFKSTYDVLASSLRQTSLDDVFTSLSEVNARMDETFVA